MLPEDQQPVSRVGPSPIHSSGFCINCVAPSGQSIFDQVVFASRIPPKFIATSQTAMFIAVPTAKPVHRMVTQFRANP